MSDRALDQPGRDNGERGPGSVPRGNVPQVKICGLTTVEEALGCVELGANAVGLVFYPPSPRNLAVEDARRISHALPSGICAVGVFVNEPFESIMHKVERCGLEAVQLHGLEPPELVKDLLREGVRVIKGLYINREPFVGSASLFGATAYIVECGGGRLPGGNAMQWDWGATASALPAGERLVLAGGLTPENVADAVRMACPDAVDVSSGVELAPGRKDLHKVRRFIDTVRRCGCPKQLKIVFDRT